MSFKLVIGIILAAVICAVTKASAFACVVVGALIFICAFFGAGQED